MILGQYMTILAGTQWHWVGTAWYQVVEGQYGAFMPVNTEKLEIWSGVTDVYRQTDNRMYGFSACLKFKA